jgi:hypothetical protein
MENELDPLSIMVLEYMLQQKLLGREKLYESEICETLGFPWDDTREDRILILTDLGENAVSLYDYKKNKGLN